MRWYNEIKPHSSLEYDKPAHAFWYRLPPERIIGYAQRWMDAQSNRCKINSGYHNWAEQLHYFFSFPLTLRISCAFAW